VPRACFAPLDAYGDRVTTENGGGADPSGGEPGPRARQAGVVLGVALAVVAILTALYKTPARAVLPSPVRNLDAPPATTSTTRADPPPTTTTVPGASALGAPGQLAHIATPPASTTTTTAPSPPATTTTVYVAPHVASQSYPGNLTYPDNISARYSETTTAGEVSGSATWSGTPDLTITVSCPGSPSASQTGTSGLYVSASSSGGTCDITIAEPSSEQATVSYTLSVQYPSN